jgi:5'-3' exonuclease
MCTTHLNLNTIHFNHESNKIHPCEQLFIVTPPLYKDILPHAYQSLYTNKYIQHYFPLSIQLDCSNKAFLWQCIPQLPVLNIHKLLPYIKEIKLNDDEEIRNRLDNMI